MKSAAVSSQAKRAAPSVAQPSASTARKSGSGEAAYYKDTYEKKANTARLLHLCLLIIAGLWAVVCIMMLNRSKERITGVCTTQSVAVCASCVLFVLEMIVTMVSRTPRFQPLAIYKLGMFQLLANTFVTLFALMTFLFHARGLNLVQCFFQETCTTLLSSESFSWKQVFETRTAVGDLSEISIKITGKTPISKTFNATNVEDIIVESASPLAASLGIFAKLCVVLCFIFWLLAVVSVILFIIRFNSDGKARLNQRLQHAPLETMALVSCSALIVITAVNFVINLDSVYSVPLVIGLVTFFPLHHAAAAARQAEQRRASQSTTQAGGDKAIAKVSSFEKREDTVQATVVLLSFTYVAGLCGCFIVCSRAKVWPTSLEPADGTLFAIGASLGCAASIGYGYSVYACLKMVQSQHLSIAQPIMPESRSCMVCESYGIEAAAQPCGHACMCWDCASHLIRSRRARCPSCRKPMDDIMKVFV
eukprot:TRINITY_DN67908_c0_g1_i1.p1 TRINITY_DN67908_c0_g1~~TRINITY_DN67908_c0_g1_i1.p1  ORF type:complete len:498 (-),score=62.25 TRINITY_DN67908_c0_g1_i1:36-1469(-)